MITGSPERQPGGSGSPRPPDRKKRRRQQYCPGWTLLASQNADKESQNNGKAPQKYVATQDKEW